MELMGINYFIVYSLNCFSFIYLSKYIEIYNFKITQSDYALLNNNYYDRYISSCNYLVIHIMLYVYMYVYISK